MSISPGRGRYSSTNVDVNDGTRGRPSNSARHDGLTPNTQCSTHGESSAAVSASSATAGRRDSQPTLGTPAANAAVATPPATSTPGVSTASSASNGISIVNALSLGAMRSTSVNTDHSRSNSMRRVTRTNGGNSVTPSSSSAASSCCCLTSSRAPEGRRPSVTPDTSQPGASTVIARGDNGKGTFTLFAAGSRPLN